jgi:hypothetical protein
LVVNKLVKVVDQIDLHPDRISESRHQNPKCEIHILWDYIFVVCFRIHQIGCLNIVTGNIIASINVVFVELFPTMVISPMIYWNKLRMCHALSIFRQQLFPYLLCNEVGQVESLDKVINVQQIFFFLVHEETLVTMCLNNKQKIKNTYSITVTNLSTESLFRKQIRFLRVSIKSLFSVNRKWNDSTIFFPSISFFKLIVYNRLWPILRLSTEIVLPLPWLEAWQHIRRRQEWRCFLFDCIRLCG